MSTSLRDLIGMDLLPDQVEPDPRVKAERKARQAARIDLMASRLHVQLGRDRPAYLTRATIVGCTSSWGVPPRLSEHLALCRAYRAIVTTPPVP